MNQRDVTGLLGLVLLTAGCAWVYPPAGLILPGVLLLALAVLWRDARRGER